jgi:hypothetical protein
MLKFQSLEFICFLSFENYFFYKSYFIRRFYIDQE